MQKVPLTARGAEKLRVELQHLKSVARPNVIKAIAEARAHGDLKENAEYHAAREQQSFIEGRINDLDSKLATAQIIDVTTVNAQGKVVFGTTVTLVNIETDEEVSYQIVGEEESDLKQNLVSITSPIARALIGKTKGDTVLVRAPGGNIEYEITDVRYV
ncbi:transcription elongation factor GreA [Gammaproteobacteria bacterium]